MFCTITQLHSLNPTHNEYATDPHLAVFGPLLKLDAQLIKPLDGGIEIIDGNANMSETSSRLVITGRIALEVGV